MGTTQIKLMKSRAHCHHSDILTFGMIQFSILLLIPNLTSISMISCSRRKLPGAFFWLPIYYVNTLIMMDLSWISFFRTTHQWRMKFAMWEGFGVLLYYSIPEYGISDGLQICCCHKWKAGVIDKWFAAGIGLTAQCLQQFCYKDIMVESSKCHNIGSGQMHHRNNFC